jgi:hypothetical protein
MSTRDCEKDILAFKLLKDNWWIGIHRLQHYGTCAGIISFKAISNEYVNSWV